MVRIFLMIVALATASGALAAVPVSVEVAETSVILQGRGGIARVQHFVLQAPPRLVVDLYGARLAGRQREIALSGGFRRLRLGSYPDKTRVVFDVAGDRLPRFEVEQHGRQGRVVVHWQDPAGTVSGGRDRTSRHPLPTAAEAGAPAMPVRPDPGLRARPPAAAAPEADAMPGHGRRIDLVDDEAAVRDILVRIAEVGGQRVVVDESVSGRLMLRLVDVPWDLALEMVLAVAGLRAVEEGGVLRITRPATGREPDAPARGGLLGRRGAGGN